MSAECKSENSDHNQKANDEIFIDPVERFTSKFESLCPKIWIPDTEEGMIQLVTLVCSRKLADSPQERFAIASACYAAIYHMGPTLRKLVQDFIPHKLLPITSIFQEFYCADNEPKINKGSIEIGVHLALMFMVSIGKTFQSDKGVAFQTERFNALAGDANLPTFNTDWEIPLYVFKVLFHICNPYRPFVPALVRRFLIPNIETLSTFEKALKIQVKPILSQIGMSDFQLSYYFIHEIINSSLIEIKEIRDEMDKPFHEACIFFQKQLDVEKPFIKLLNLPGSSVLDSKNFPNINYAAQFIVSHDNDKCTDYLINQARYNSIYNQIGSVVIYRKEYFKI